MNLRQMAIGVVLLSLGGACKGSGSGEASTERVVARVSDGSITVSELQAKLGEQPAFVRARYKELERKKEFLESMIRFELLSQEARKQKLEQDPEVQATLEKLLVQRLVQKHAEQTDAQPVSEHELKAYYDAHLSEFVRPERVRVSHIFLASAGNDPKRSQVKAQADALLAELRRKEAGAAGAAAFAELAQRTSGDVASKAAGGDLGLKTREELNAQWGGPFASAAFALREIGDSGLVATDRGLHLVKMTGRQPGLEQSFEEVKPRIESRARMERRARAMDALVEKLRKSASIKVDDEVLGQVDVQADAGKGTAQAGTP